MTGLAFAAAGTAAVASSLQVIYERIFGQRVGVLFGVLVADSVISGPARTAATL